MTPRIHTSEPAFRAPISQSQRESMGKVQPMESEDGVRFLRGVKYGLAISAPAWVAGLVIANGWHW